MKPEVLRFLLGVGVFKLVTYLFNTTNFIPNLVYARFGVILTQFYVNFSRQEHQIDMSYRYRSKPENLRFHSIPPFIFPLQSL